MNEYIKLLIIISAPLALVLFTTFILYLNRHKDRSDWSFVKFNSTFDAKHGLASQPIFWMTIVYPIGIFFSTGIWVWYGRSLDISADGFSTFIEISKLPLGLLGLSIPLSVLTARLHGTKQTALQISKAQRQIEETQQKNKTDLYLAHYNHFCDHISMLEMNYRTQNSDKCHLTFNKKSLYKQLFPEATLATGVSKLSFDLFDRISHRIALLYGLFEESQVTNANEANQIIEKLNTFVRLTLHEMSIIDIEGFLKTEFRGGRSYLNDDAKLIDFVDFLCSTIQFVYEFQMNLQFEELSQLRVNLVPGELPDSAQGKIGDWYEIIRRNYSLEEYGESAYP
ncbi:hypothetical protein ACNPKB_10900 [Shewanella marisflavi]|uniref:hypothetical protein n=1 Tax=Shewanella marisflavi TaxID=260364 RepID=UPI003AAEEE1B